MPQDICVYAWPETLRLPFNRHVGLRGQVDRLTLATKTCYQTIHLMLKIRQTRINFQPIVKKTPQMSNRIPLPGAITPIQRLAAHADWLMYRHRYPQNVVYIAGLPKSGSTWLSSMFRSIPGFHGDRHHVTPTNNDLRPDTFRAI